MKQGKHCKRAGFILCRFEGFSKPFVLLNFFLYKSNISPMIGTKKSFWHIKNFKNRKHFD